MKIIVLVATLSGYFFLHSLASKTEKKQRGPYLLQPPKECPPPGFKPSETFNLTKYIAHPWYIQAQMDIAYTIGQDTCVGAYYTLSNKRRGFTGFFEGLFGLNKQKTYVDVHNTAKYSESNETVEASLIAVTDSQPGTLKVGLNFLPESFWGPYWVVAHDDDYDWAIVSGGEPKEVGAGGYCKTHSGTNGAGLWLFTKKQNPDRKRVLKLTMLARSLGFDVTVLKPVSQNGCNYTALENPFPVVESKTLTPLTPAKEKNEDEEEREELKNKVKATKEKLESESDDDDDDDKTVSEKPIIVDKKNVK